MEGTRLQADGDSRSQPRIGRSFLKVKKDEYHAVMVSANRALRKYSSEFRTLKNMDNKRWNVILKNKKDVVLVKVLEKQLDAVVKKTRVLEGLQP